MAVCPNLENCGFIKKFGDSKALAISGFISIYCKSDKQNECKRKLFKANYGTPPPDHMMPNGTLIK